MHFSLPDVTHLADGEQAPSYVGYNIHINGSFHCTVRYRQLHSLHVQLHQQYPTLKLPPFPPKKILPLTNSKVEERRLLLERYLQLVGQNSILSNSDLLVGFLISAQQETFQEKHEGVSLDVYFMNGLRIPLIVSSTDRTDEVLENACTHIFLPTDLIKYFSLYIIEIDEATNEIVILKKLEDFESPYISLKLFKSNHKIYIRKSYWDISYDSELISDRVAIELLYAQTVAEVLAGWITAPPAILDRLQKYQLNNQKKEYLELARHQRHYGYIMAGQGLAEWGSGGATKGYAQVLLGHSGLLLLTQDHHEAYFKVVRMRCWRITSKRVKDDDNHLQNGHATNGTEHSSNNDAKLELSFEYLMNKDSLQWITVHSDRAMFMSVCLQSIVDELMHLKNYGGLHGSSERSTVYRGTSKKNSLTYLKRDGSSHVITPSSSTDTLSSGNGDTKSLPSPKEKFSIRKLSEKFASVTFRPGQDCVENNAFEGIGDDDL